MPLPDADWRPGALVHLEERSCEIVEPVCSGARSWRAKSAGQLVWLWRFEGFEDAASAREALERADSPILPRARSLDALYDEHILVLDPCAVSCAPFDENVWRALPRATAIQALRHLARGLGEMRELGYCPGGLRREQLVWDGERRLLCLGDLSRGRSVLDEPEDLWRDIKLVGELLFENFIGRDYIGGHELAAILQKPDRLREEGLIQPGLTQVLAGCVTPYGDLAYKSAVELDEALGRLEIEMEQPLELDIGACSTTGNYIFRRNNQDSCGHMTVQTVLGSRRVTLGFFCVADGIGGIQDGERASALAIRSGCAAFGRAWSHDHGAGMCDRPIDTARAIAKVTSQQLALEGEFDPAGNSGGTTYSSLIIADRYAGIGHVGDSRIYIVRDRAITQLTIDHNLSRILESLGELEGRSEQSRQVAERTISRFMTTAHEIELARIDAFDPACHVTLGVDERGLKIRRGDTFIMTSDGAHGDVDAAAMLELSTHAVSAKQLCEQIADKAISAFARDNVTVLVVRVV